MKLMEIHNVSAYKLTGDIGINHSSINGWKKGLAKPSFDAIIKISDYFSVTTDYLLGRTDDPNPVGDNAPYITPEEFAVVERLRNLTPEKRRAVEALLNQL